MDAVMERFIMDVRKYDFLWNSRHPLNKDRTERLKAWKKISQNSGMSVDRCRKKWRGLRDSYRRDTKKVWIHRKHLEFLEDHKQQKAITFDAESSSSLSTIGFEDTVDSVQEQPIKCNPLSPIASACDSAEFEKPQITTSFHVTPDTEHAENSRGKKRQNLEDLVMTTLETMRELLKRPRYDTATTDDKDEDELFCLSVMQNIKKYPRDLKNKAKIGMLRYLNAFETAHIDELKIE